MEVAFDILKGLKHFYYYMKRAHLGLSLGNLKYDIGKGRVR